MGMISLDVSPALLIPFYDEDSSTVFLTGKGDTTIYAYEVIEEAPYLFPLSHHHENKGAHQGLSFLPKNQCNVSIVEFAKCYRLTSNSIEPLNFTVPRIKVIFKILKFPLFLLVLTSNLFFAERVFPGRFVSTYTSNMDANNDFKRVV
jgi:coronin-7